MRVRVSLASIWVSMLLLAMTSSFSLAARSTAAVAELPQSTYLSEHPLAAPDRSSPRETMRSFLVNAENAWRDAFDPSGQRSESAWRKTEHRQAVRCLDLSDLPVDLKQDIGTEAATMLFDVFNRIRLPDLDAIPDAAEMAEREKTRWKIPNTPIEIVRKEEGPRMGEWLFSADTVRRVEEYYRQTRELPLKPGAVVEDGYLLLTTMGGWMIPAEWLLRLPAWTRTVYGKQSVWQWLSGAALLLIAYLVARSGIRWSLSRGRPGPAEPLRFLATPVLLMVLASTVMYLLDQQINITGEVLVALRWFFSIIFYLAAAWGLIRGGAVIANKITVLPTIAEGNIEPDLVRALCYIISIVTAAFIVAYGASNLGIPLLGVITGLGIGGIAVALAAQSTLENILGGIAIFSDGPVRVGDFARLGDEKGTVERIGLRSTQVRTLARTLISIPNGQLAKQEIENYASRDKILFRHRLPLRLDSTAAQLNRILQRIREVLENEPHVLAESVRVRLVALGPVVNEIEVYAYVGTDQWAAFLAVQEDLFLRILAEIEQAGSQLAPPSQLHFNVEQNAASDGSASTP